MTAPTLPPLPEPDWYAVDTPGADVDVTMTKSMAEALELSGDGLPDVSKITSLYAGGRVREIVSAHLAALQSAAPAEVAGAQCRFVGDEEWRPCEPEHHALVQSRPHEWPGYETRLVYATPPQAAQPAALPAGEVTDDQLRLIDDAHDWTTTAGRLAAMRAVLALRPSPAQEARVCVKVQGGETHSAMGEWMGDDIGYLVCVPREWQTGATAAPAVTEGEREDAAQRLQGHIRTMKAAGRYDGMVEDMERAAAALRWAAGGQEAVYQYQRGDGSWIDQTKTSHDYNVKHGAATVRVVYTTPQPTAAAAAGQVPEGFVLVKKTALRSKREVFQAGRDSYQTACAPMNTDDEAWEAFAAPQPKEGGE